MNEKPDNEDLLAEVMAEETGFREAMLGETLRLARGRRRWHQTRRAAVVVLIVGAIALAVGYNWPAHQSGSPPTLAMNKAVPPQPSSPYEVITTRPLPMVIVNTEPGSGGVHEINDDELLTLVAARPAILVQIGKNSSALVFANPEDQKGFPIN